MLLQNSLRLSCVSRMAVPSPASLQPLAQTSSTASTCLSIVTHACTLASAAGWRLSLASALRVNGAYFRRCSAARIEA